jgi:hypothetical protein
VRKITELLGNPINYGTQYKTRCMSDCIKVEVLVLKIKNKMNNFTSSVSTLMDLPQVEKVY